MAFNALNAKTVSRLVQRSTVTTTDGLTEALETGMYNLFHVWQPVDVSGMEFAVTLERNSLSGTPGLDVQTGSPLSLGFRDGGASGDNATVADLIVTTVFSNTTVFTARVPKEGSGTSTVDLDTLDWVNFVVAANPTTVSGAASVVTEVDYIFGVPGGIAT